MMREVMPWLAVLLVTSAWAEDPLPDPLLYAELKTDRWTIPAIGVVGATVQERERQLQQELAAAQQQVIVARASGDEASVRTARESEAAAQARLAAVRDEWRRILGDAYRGVYLVPEDALEIDFDESSLFLALARHAGATPHADDLTQAGEQLTARYGLMSKWMPLEARFIRLTAKALAAQLAGDAGATDLAAIRPDMQALLGEFDAWLAVAEAQEVPVGEAWLDPGRVLGRDVTPGTNWTAMAQFNSARIEAVSTVLQRHVQRLTDQFALAAAAEERYRLYLSAEVYAADGSQHQVRIVGYDTLPATPATPYRYFKPLSSPALAKELEDLERDRERVKGAVKDVRDLVESSLASVKAGAERLAEQVETSLDSGRFSRALDELMSLGEEVAALRGDVERLQQLAKDLRTLPNLVRLDSGDEMLSDAAFLLEASQKVDALASLLVTGLGDLRDLSETLPIRLEAARAALNTEAQAAVAELEQALDGLLRQIDGLSLFKLAKVIATHLLEERKSIITIDTLLPRTVGREPLDTVVQYHALPSEARDPQGRLVLRAYLVDEEGHETDAAPQLDEPQGQVAFRTEVTRLRGGPATAMVFPNIGDHFTPSTSLGYYWHPNSRWPADIGFGLNLNTLHLNNKPDTELGIGGGITLFRDRIWAGGGYNTDNGRGYYYFGVNMPELWEMLPGGG